MNDDLFDDILFDFKVDAAHIDPAHKGDCLVTLDPFCLVLLMGYRLLYKNLIESKVWAIIPLTVNCFLPHR